MGKGPHPAILNAMIKSCLHPQVAFDPSVHSVMTIIKQTIRYLADVQMDITGCYMFIEQNLNGEAYGIDRLQRTIIAVADLSPHEIQWRILRDLGDHVTNALSGGNTMIAVIKAD